MKFIYVFTESDRDFLSALGYELLKQCHDKPIWVFVNKEDEMFSTFSTCSYVLSDTLTF